MLWLNRLSLDAPLIAIVWQMLFARALRIELRPATTFILAASVWMIYVIDRLMDARKPDEAFQPGLRHRFYTRYGRYFYGPVVLVGAGCLAALQLVPPFVVHDGLTVVAAVAVYLVSVHYFPRAAQWYFPKEYASAAIFAAGVTLPFWARMTQADCFELTAIAIFCALCFCNTVAIEFWESAEADRVVAAYPTLWLGIRIPYATAILACASLALLRTSELFAAEFFSAACLTSVAVLRPHLRVEAACALVDAALFAPVFLLAFM